MRVCVRGAAVAALLLAWGSATAFAQAGYVAPRAKDRHADLQGVWTNASLTTLERGSGFKSTELTPEQAAQMERARAAGNAAANAPTRSEEGAPNSGGNIGGYNAFWGDPGTRFGVVNGKARAAWISDPVDGRIPYSTAGRKAFEKGHAIANADFNGPEGRTPADRCIMGFGSTGAPPMMNVLYNNHYQIVQTPTHLMIMAEMNHDARIIPIGAKGSVRHQPAVIGNWMGDSIGWWEGDTLVIETVSVNPQNVLRPTGGFSFYLGEHPVITEKLTRIGSREILYEFRVEDPAAFTQGWGGAIPLNAAEGPIYEYACHEGNYALPDMLRGARVFEGKKRTNVLDYYAKSPR
jgi:hypothetical protein